MTNDQQTMSPSCLRAARSSMYEKRLVVLQVDVEDQEFEEEFLSQEDPSMLHFLLASGEEASPPSLNA